MSKIKVGLTENFNMKTNINTGSSYTLTSRKNHSTVLKYKFSPPIPGNNTKTFLMHLWTSLTVPSTVSWIIQIGEMLFSSYFILL